MGGLAARCAEILEEFNAEHFFDSDQDRCALPLAQALVDVAQEHFAFFSADGQLTTDGAEATFRCGRPIREPDVGLDGLPSTESEITLRRLEAARLQLTGEVKRLVSSRATAPQRPAVPLLPARPKPAARRPTPGAGGRPLDLKAMYPLLGPGVASAALQAGIPHSSLGALRGLLDKGAG